MKCGNVDGDSQSVFISICMCGPLALSVVHCSYTLVSLAY